MTDEATEDDQTAWSIPRTDAEEFDLIHAAPSGWQGLLFAGTLIRGRDSLNSAWLDYLLGFRRPTGIRVADEDIIAHVDQGIDELLMYTGNLGAVINSPLQAHALNTPDGVPPDPDLVRHIANRYIENYQLILDWAATLRGTVVSDEALPVIDAAVGLSRRPLHEIRDFIDEFATSLINALTGPVVEEERRVVATTIALTSDTEALEQYRAASERFLRTLYGKS